MPHSPLPSSAPSRRRILGGLAGLGALAVTGGLTGCSAPSVSAQDGTRMRYWHLFGGGDGVNMQQMLADFRSAHPEIALEDATLQWGAPYYTKLGMAGAGGRAPEVAAMHLTRVPGFAPGRLLDAFDLDLLAEYGVRPKDFPPHLWRRGTFDGRQYAVPLDTHPQVLYYNTEVCERAGLLDDDGVLVPLSGVERFTEAVRAVTKATGKPGLVTEALGPDVVGPLRFFHTFYSQTGGTIVDEEATRITLDDDKALRVLEWMALLAREGLVTTHVDYNGAVGAFNHGDSGFFVNGEWEVSTFLNNKLPFSMTRVPALFGRPTTQADCHCFVLPHQRDRGGPGNEAAHQFVAWMLRHTVAWAQGGHVPAYLPTLSQPAYLKLEPQSEYREVIDDVVLDPPAWFAGSASVMQIELGEVLSGVFTGSRTPRNALREVRKRLRDLLDTENPFGADA